MAALEHLFLFYDELTRYSGLYIPTTIIHICDLGAAEISRLKHIYFTLRQAVVV